MIPRLAGIVILPQSAWRHCTSNLTLEVHHTREFHPQTEKTTTKNHPSAPGDSMRILLVYLLAVLLAPLCVAGQSEKVDDELLARIITRERGVVEDLRGFHPLVETYIQSLRKEHGSLVPWRDRYFLSHAEFSGQLRALRFKPRGLTVERSSKDFMDSVAPNDLEFDPSGFVAMAFPDPDTFDLQHYQFQYVKKEFLGEVRCFVFDVRPIATRKSGLFEGRVWVEEEKLTIVRFNGIYHGSNFYSKYFHFDSWRVNVDSGRWVPAAIYSEELNLPCCGIGKFNWTKLHFKAQTRFWGYNTHYAGREEAFTEIVLDPSSGIRDQFSAPTDQQGAWMRQAEDNILDKLESVGLLAPTGEVEKTLEQVVSNLETTNQLHMEPEMRCRVLLTSKLESSVVGHTIIVSRGLLDVLPNEAVLAAVLANGLALASLDDRSYESYGFADSVRFAARDTFRQLHFTHSKTQEEAAMLQAQQWMKHSPYGESLNSINRFIAELSSCGGPMRQLLDASIGDSAYDLLDARHANPKLLHVEGSTEASALPLGSRVLINPWDDTIRLRSAGNTAPANGETQGFTVTPMTPYLRINSDPTSAGILPASVRAN